MKKLITGIWMTILIIIYVIGVVSCSEPKPKPSGCYTEYLNTADGRAYYLLHCKDTVYRITVPPRENETSSKYSTKSR